MSDAATTEYESSEDMRTSVECSSEESKAEEKPVEFINDVPIYAHAHLLNGKFKIFERIGYDDRVGATYWAVCDDKEMVIRVDKPSGLIVQMEATFLAKTEKANDWRLFSQVHSTWTDEAGHFHLALYFRPGPTLYQCQTFYGRPFSLGTAGRFLVDVFEIVEAIHRHDYLMRALNADMLHFDANARRLFLADLSTLRADPTKKGITATTSWEGGCLFAPLAADFGEPLTPSGDLEAALFFGISMIVDALPWQDCYQSEVAHHKALAIKSRSLFTPLPEMYGRMHNVIVAGGATPAKSVYEELRALAKQVYEVGGIHDLDANFDFEREPTEEELPRFVMEKAPANGDRVQDGDLAPDADEVPTLPLF